MHMSDEGLKFSATLKTADGFITREAATREQLLKWVRFHVDHIEQLTVTVEATGVAALPMLIALELGQIRSTYPVTRADGRVVQATVPENERT